MDSFDSLQPKRLISAGQAKIRESLVRDQLRRVGLRAALLCDSFFVRGVLNRQHWQALHSFRGDLLEMPRRTKQDGRGPLPADARKRKVGGFRMSCIPIERALMCPKVMDGECYRVALILVGEGQGKVSDEEARTAAWQVNEIYNGNAGTDRWREWG